MSKLQRSSAGFTIIELLIATAVFSVVLVSLSAAIVQISRTFYKGLTAANTQEVTRSILAEVAQSLQFDPVGYLPGLVNGGNSLIHAACIGSVQYSYLLGVEQGSSTGNSAHILVRNPQGACSTTAAQDVTASTVNGVDLGSPKMRLAKFDIQSITDPVTNVVDPDLYRITVRVVYGDDDLICDSTYHIPSSPAGLMSCNDPATMPALQMTSSPANLRCKNIHSGTQFCAVSELSTIVEKRIP